MPSLSLDFYFAPYQARPSSHPEFHEMPASLDGLEVRDSTLAEWLEVGTGFDELTPLESLDTDWLDQLPPN
ncbi:hypothetical protein QRD43_07535 [Pelomonas sp. APW6]|uniref:Uncharacterized protein n=1 Tax=Roseateles subflavus TaxID=3053353 RepID=A0ABT7LFX6_9BURK|nr:hypothetical protein [Pelomonas sp. APW6]MDL5031757.1 hypothetical protein [Pelomonas sp. APW6]